MSKIAEVRVALAVLSLDGWSVHSLEIWEACLVFWLFLCESDSDDLLLANRMRYLSHVRNNFRHQPEGIDTVSTLRRWNPSKGVGSHHGSMSCWDISCWEAMKIFSNHTERQKMCQRWSTRSYTVNIPCPRSSSENQLHFQILDAYCSDIWMPSVVISPSDVSCSDIGHAFKKTLMHVLLLIAKRRSEVWKMNNFRIAELRLKRTAA